MREDNVYPATTAFTPFDTQAEEQRDARIEKRAFEEKRDIIKELIDRIREERIPLYESIHGIPTDIRLDEKKLAIRVDSMAETAANLRAELNYLESLVDAYDKK